MSRIKIARADMLAARGGESCDHGIRSPLCPACHADKIKRRCSACGYYKTLDNFDGVGTCTECLRGRSEYRRRVNAGEHQPERRPAKLKLCWTCGSLPHRVIGPECRECGIAFAPDIVIGDAWKRKPSQWAILMGGSEDSE